MPRDTETGERVTSNPLMLSMIASIADLRRGIAMPATIAELYKVASDAMLTRGGASSDALRKMLQRIFFEAHVAQRRVIEDRKLDEAALGMDKPEALAAIRATSEGLRVQGSCGAGHYVEVVAGEHIGKSGIITTDDGTGVRTR